MLRLNQFQVFPASRESAALCVTVAVLVFVLAAGQGGMANEISTKNFEIAGITLGATTNQDLERILGPAPAMDTPDHEGARQPSMGHAWCTSSRLIDLLRRKRSYV
jgi:hypothetical protein